ncbi:hypothetical protein [Nitratireductor sp. GCM10026969]|uniref:hypothetical protein n=1 Tax=Nitratireductor sp. GCM10026969 TaxID=3252645 RepID=UPI00361D383A
MSSKAVVLKRNSGDDAKRRALLGIGPTPLIEFTASGKLSTDKKFVGSLDYLLLTGGHGNFVNSRPTQCNGTTVEDTNRWAFGVSGQFKAIILDTCFSSALLATFLPMVPYGGCVVCAHGSGEGWAEGFTAANGNKSVGEILCQSVKGMDELGLVSNMAIAVRKPTNQLLYTMNGGAKRRPALDQRDMFGMDRDSEIELKQLDVYLFGNQISVIEAQGLSHMKTMLANWLPMKIV